MDFLDVFSKDRKKQSTIEDISQIVFDSYIDKEKGKRISEQVYDALKKELDNE